MAAIARYYSSTAVKTTLSSSIGSADSTMTTASMSGFPSSYPYTLILEIDSANEEIVTVTALVGTSLTITRGVDGTSGRSHSAGTSVEHGVIALDFTNLRAHEANAANVHDIGAGASAGAMKLQTAEVMQQQKVLMDNIKTMQPYLETAERFLDKFNMKGIDGLLGKIGMGSNAAATPGPSQ